ncbi:MAG TPA: hypothetical protein VEX43_13915 [Chthoniobacterales bacterium]|nr:hypothetical protein [Chthoniobacterales bacterium]
MSAGLTIETAARAKWRDAIAQRELAIFFSLAFLLSWYPWLLALAQGRTSGPNPLGPFVAALIVAGLVEGWPGIRELLARIVRGRIGLRWYGVIFGLPVALCAIAVAIMAAFGTSNRYAGRHGLAGIAGAIYLHLPLHRAGRRTGLARICPPALAEGLLAVAGESHPRADLGALAFAAHGK